MKDRVQLYLGSLLHDIGKPLERAGFDASIFGDWYKSAKYSHSGIGAAFLEKHKHSFISIREYLDGVQRIVRNHHDPSEMDERIVQLSDWLSSGERREIEVGEEEEVLKAKDARLLSIFAKVFESNKSNNYYYKLSSLELQRLFPVKSGRVEADNYENLMRSFEENLGKFSEFPSPSKLYGEPLLEAIFHYFYKYFWSVPAQTPRAGYEPDVSLFDHSKITSALSICLYDDIQHKIITNNEVEEACRKLLNFSFNPPEDEPLLSKNLFLLVGGDLSGIQDFIFNVPSKGAAKSLKGRSLYLELLTEVTAKLILRKFDLPLSNLIYSGGGNFYLLVPISRESELEMIRREVLKVLLDAHAGSLYFAISWTSLAIKDFFEGRIVNKWRELSENSSNLKRKRFSELNLKENFFKLFGPFQSRDESGDLCQVCHLEKELLEVTEEDEKICPFCNSFKELAENLKNANYYCEGFIDTEFEVSRSFTSYIDVFKAFGLKASFTREPTPGCLNYVLNRIFEWEISPNVVGFRFFPLGIPLKENQIRAFDEISQESEGLKALGLLKMDVDNLGCIFREGLPKEQRTLSRIATLSRLFHLFFSGWVNQIWENNFRDTAYIIFAGGDDSLILGAWDKLYEFMKLVRSDFGEFVGENSNVTLSSSYSIFPLKSPVVKSVAVVEDCLSEAKARSLPKPGLPSSYREKNVLSILGVPLKHSEFQKMDELFFELLRVKDEEGEEYALRLARKVIRATRGFKTILEDSLYGTLKPERIWRFAYFLRKEKKDLELVEKLIKMNEEIVLENLAGKRIVENYLILPLAARLVDYKLRKT